MTIYQKELLRQLSNLGCAGYEDDQSGMLNITMDGLPLCIAGKKGDLYWDKENVVLPERRKAVDALCKAADLVREYVSLYEVSPQMKPESVPEYRQLAEYGSIVLGAMYSETHGFMFSTWTQYNGGKTIEHGDYSPSYEYAKESFATRAKLIDKYRLFSETEAENLYRCIDYALENCESLTYEQEEQLKDLKEKLTFGYPKLENEPPSFDQDEAPQLNM